MFSDHGQSSNSSSHSTAVKYVLHKWETTFKDKGIPEPESSAQLIVAHVLGKKMVCRESLV